MEEMSYVIKPEEHELRRARSKVEKTVKKCQTIMKVEEGLEISIGHVEDYVDMRPAYGGATSGNSIFVKFNTEKEWEEDLGVATAYAYAQGLFLEKSGFEPLEFIWQEILAEAFTLEFIKLVFPERSGELPETGKEPEIWDGIRDRLGKQIDSVDKPVETLGKKIGGKLAENKGLEEMTSLTRSDIRDAGDEVFT